MLTKFIKKAPNNVLEACLVELRGVQRHDLAIWLTH